MYVPAFLSLNKKPAKSHSIHKPKRLGSTERNILGVQNRLNPCDLKLRMVPNINIALLLVQEATKTDHIWYPKTCKNFQFCDVSSKSWSFCDSCGAERSRVVFKKGINDLLRYFGDQILEIHTVLLYQTFVLLCFPLRFLLSNPLWWPDLLRHLGTRILPTDAVFFP